MMLLSGPIAVGKSSVIAGLVENHDFRRLSSGQFLKNYASETGQSPTRSVFTQLGDSLDDETNFQWVVDQVALPALASDPTHKYWVFDSVRKRLQVEHFRTALPDAIFHVHLTASEEVLQDRFDRRNRIDDQTLDYPSAINTDNERESRSLGAIADRTIVTDGLDPSHLILQVAGVFLEWSKLS